MDPEREAETFILERLARELKDERLKVSMYKPIAEKLASMYCLRPSFCPRDGICPCCWAKKELKGINDTFTA